jgi:hypothetical protein
MCFDFGIVAVATLLSGVLGQWPQCESEKAIGTECPWLASPGSCYIAPNRTQAVIVCEIVDGDYENPVGTWNYEVCPTLTPICWSEYTGAFCSLADAQGC